MGQPRMVRVKARIAHTDAATGMPRVAEEKFDMPLPRAKLKASQGFVDLIDSDDEVIIEANWPQDVVDDTPSAGKASSKSSEGAGAVPARPAVKKTTAVKKATKKKT